MNDVTSLKAKLSSSRKQVESLKQEVAIAHKVRVAHQRSVSGLCMLSPNHYV